MRRMLERDRDTTGLEYLSPLNRSLPGILRNFFFFCIFGLVIIKYMVIGI